MNTEEKKDYYVYLHKRKDNDEVFYIGSGRLNRCNVKDKSRSKDWLNIVESVGFYSEKIVENLSKKEAMDVEHKNILNPQPYWKLINKVLPTQIIDLDYDIFSELFYYDESSPSGLRYKKDVHTGYYTAKYKDDIAGNIHRQGKSVVSWRVKVTVNNKKHSYKVHRLIWLLINKAIDSSKVIDHIDNNPLNNRIENLRLVSYHVNGRNKTPGRVNAKTKIVGIIKRNGAFLAQFRDSHGKRTTKTYTISKYGEEQALYLAAKTRYCYINAQEDNLKFTDSHSCLDKLLKIITDFESQGEYLGIESIDISRFN